MYSQKGWRGFLLIWIFFYNIYEAKASYILISGTPELFSETHW